MRRRKRALGAVVLPILVGCAANDPAPLDSGGAAAQGGSDAGASQLGGGAGTGGGTSSTSAGSVASSGGSGVGGSIAGVGGASGAPSTGGDGVGGAGGSVGTATCEPKDVTPKPTAVNVSERGAPFSGKHQMVVEVDPGLPGYTIYRPQDLAAASALPIVTWGQGGCSRNGTTSPEFLGEIASQGYLVVADGEPNGSGNRAQTSDYKAMGQPLVKALDWALAEHARPCSQYFGKLAQSKTAVMGFSCGGLMAEGASSDPRWTTVVLWSSGMISPTQQVLDDMHAPTAIILGGEQDIAFGNGSRDYEGIDEIPALLASTDVGHGGTYGQDNGGAFGKVAVAWLAWWLRGDVGAMGKGRFVGTGCGLCTDPQWTVKSKRLP